MLGSTVCSSGESSTCEKENGLDRSESIPKLLAFCTNKMEMGGEMNG